MPLHGQWRNNAELERWEATIGPYLAVARFDRHSDRYMAYIDSQDGSAPDHYAPASFSDPEAAKAWCEEEIARLAADPRPERGPAAQIGDLLSPPDPEL